MNTEFGRKILHGDKTVDIEIYLVG